VDEWDRYYSLNVMDASARPVLLTTTDGLIEDQTSIAVSADGKTFYYCTNAKDIERRHIWAVPVGGGTPVRSPPAKAPRPTRLRSRPASTWRRSAPVGTAAIARRLEDGGGRSDGRGCPRRRSSSPRRAGLSRWTRT
jgi:hypothetical protein